MNSHIKDDNHQIVSDYFRLIAKKDMHGLLKLFTDDCIVYEPFSRRLAGYESPNNTTNSTLSSSIVSVLTTFYRNQGADKLQVAD